MIPEKTLTSSLILFAVGATAGFTQQDLLAWSATIAAAILLFIPTYQKVMDALHKNEATARDIRRKDCTELLKQAKKRLDEANQRIKSLEKQLGEWEKLHDAGSGNYPRME
jgi:hypothetical protein